VGAPVAWFEIAGPDPRSLIDFYTELFEWSVGDSGDPGYALVDTGSGGDAIAGGIAASQSPDDRGGVTIYMKVDDLQAHLDKVAKLGGSVVVPPTDLPGDFGRFALFTDPAGNTVGLWS
jgi:predicted enzyme related to lactoylglutathione lyase